MNKRYSKEFQAEVLQDDEPQYDEELKSEIANYYLYEQD